MGSGTALQPWDDAALTARLLEVVCALPRVRLDRLDAPAMPGCYLQFFATERVEPALGALVASGRYVAYVGVASRSLRERVGRYRQSIDGLDAVREDDVSLAVLPCASTASARFAEAALIERLEPVLNGLGWGSKPQGARRAGQRCSPVDALFPGRRWAAVASSIDQARARMQVVAALAALDPCGPRWPALVDGVTPRPARHLRLASSG